MGVHVKYTDDHRGRTYSIEGLDETVMLDIVDGLHLQAERYELSVTKMAEVPDDDHHGHYGNSEDLWFLHGRLAAVHELLFFLADEGKLQVRKQMPGVKVVLEETPKRPVLTGIADQLSWGSLAKHPDWEYHGSDPTHKNCGSPRSVHVYVGGKLRCPNKPWTEDKRVCCDTYDGTDHLKGCVTEQQRGVTDSSGYCLHHVYGGCLVCRQDPDFHI